MRTLIADRGAGEPVSLGAALTAGKKIPPDATRLLSEDHRIVLGWFDWYADAEDAETRRRVAMKIVMALRAHMAAEEEIFYPAAQEATGEEELVRRAFDEHAEAKALMESISDTDEPDTQIATMEKLREEIEQHIDEEENELFPEVRRSGLDLFAVGAAIAARRVEALFQLRAAAGIAPAADLKETPPMPVSKEEARELFVVGLRNAHATANQGKTMVEAEVKRLDNYPRVQAKLQAHLEEKEKQRARIEQILDSMGENTSAVKDATMSFMASMNNLANAMAGDEILKSSFAAYALANYESAAYETLLLFAEAAGETAAMRPLQQSLSEERAMAAFIGANLRGVGMQFLQLRSEGARASR